MRIEKAPEEAQGNRVFRAALARVRSESAILHLRQATEAENLLENTHPFLVDGFAFAHNGGISAAQPLRSKIASARRSQCHGDTDSELMFLALLTAIDRMGDAEKAARYVLGEIRGAFGHTGLNFLLLTADALYAACAFDPGAPLLRRDPNYYSLYVRTREDDVVVASSGWDPADSWTPLGNGRLLRVDRETLATSITEIF